MWFKRFIRVVALLLVLGFKVLLKSRSNQASYATALVTAAAAGENNQVVNLLQKLDADPDVSIAWHNAKGVTPLMAAAASGSTDCVQALLSYRALPDLTDSRGWSALHYACANGQQECAVVLVKAGAHKGLENADHQTPAALAQAAGFNGVAQSVISTEARMTPLRQARPAGS